MNRNNILKEFTQNKNMLSCVLISQDHEIKIQKETAFTANVFHVNVKYFGYSTDPETKFDVYTEKKELVGTIKELKEFLKQELKRKKILHYFLDIKK